MPEKKFLPLEVGKFYEDRNGGKIRIYATNGNPEMTDTVHGAKLHEEGYWGSMSWDINGNYWSGKESPHDIIGPWVDKPIVNWPAMPEWVNALAMNKLGTWYGYESSKPTWGKGGFATLIHPDYYPTNEDGTPWTGDCQDSLCERPEEAK